MSLATALVIVLAAAGPPNHPDLDVGGITVRHSNTYVEQGCHPRNEWRGGGVTVVTLFGGWWDNQGVYHASENGQGRWAIKCSYRPRPHTEIGMREYHRWTTPAEINQIYQGNPVVLTGFGHPGAVTIRGI